jgi:hypothetical protein
VSGSMNRAQFKNGTSQLCSQTEELLQCSKYFGEKSNSRNKFLDLKTVSISEGKPVVGSLILLIYGI